MDGLLAIFFMAFLLQSVAKITNSRRGLLPGCEQHPSKTVLQ